MIRVFSEAKKEELYRVLDMIDDKGWEPFGVWSGRRGYEFGEWANRLGIYNYMRQTEYFQNKILTLNSITRKQIEANFEGVENIDARGADAFREYAETVKEQIKAVRIMMQFMQSAGKTGTDIEVLLQSLTLQSKHSYAEQLEEGRKVLLSYLSVRGITDPAEQQEIYDLIMEEQPYLLASLYTADYYSGEDAIVIYNSIMDYYYKYKAEEMFESYLISFGYTNCVEREFVIDMICEAQPDSLLDWYYADIYKTSDCEEITESIKKYYIENKKKIKLETIEERFRNDKRANQYSVVCGYLEYLVDLQYICQAECDQYVSGMEEGHYISSDKKAELCEFMLERKEFIEAFAENKVMSNKVKDAGWTQGQIMCALQIDIKLTDAGLDKEFIAGLIGNIKFEGEFGLFEGVNKDGKLNGEIKKYWVHMMKCVDYYNVYHKKNLTDLNLIQVYVDFIYKREHEECTDKDNHKMGVGAVQWTDPGRSKKLMEFYLEQAGYDMNSDQFGEFIQEWQNKEEKDEIFLTEKQIRDAEIKMIVYELTSEDQGNKYYKIYKEYAESRSDKNQEALWDATSRIMNKYENPSEGLIDERLAAAERWYENSKQ